jgi:hypothetical protein
MRAGLALARSPQNLLADSAVRKQLSFLTQFDSFSR